MSKKENTNQLNGIVNAIIRNQNDVVNAIKTLYEWGQNCEKRLQDGENVAVLDLREVMTLITENKIIVDHIYGQQDLKNVLPTDIHKAIKSRVTKYLKIHSTKEFSFALDFEDFWDLPNTKVKVNPKTDEQKAKALHEKQQRDRKRLLALAKNVDCNITETLQLIGNVFAGDTDVLIKYLKEGRNNV